LPLWSFQGAPGSRPRRLSPAPSEPPPRGRSLKTQQRGNAEVDVRSRRARPLADQRAPRSSDRRAGRPPG